MGVSVFLPPQLPHNSLTLEACLDSILTDNRLKQCTSFSNK